ncbi:hypothetical protein EUZ85_25515 [Hahella sp. KA22]|nr:hypothetical protein ENC22_22935 [Hahella sp. KA22]QAY57268.1 hypothetical protein EUZ85_25515 [Hahella sp. KA22]
MTFMAINNIPTKLSHNASSKDQLERQLFRDVQRLIRYLDSRKSCGSSNPAMVESYERMILERCDVLGQISRM